MLYANLAIGSLVIAIFAGVCAIDTKPSVRMLTLPVAVVALAAAILLYGMSYFR